MTFSTTFLNASTPLSERLTPSAPYDASAENGLLTSTNNGLRLPVGSATVTAQSLEVSTSLQNQVQNLDAAAEAVQKVSGALAVAQNAIARLHTISQQIADVSSSANATTATAQTRTLSQAKVTSLVQEFDSIASNATFAGVHLLTSGGVPATPTVVQVANAATDTGSAVGNNVAATATFTSPLTVGNIIVAGFTHGDGYNGGGGAGVIAAPAGFTLAQTVDNNFNTGVSVYTHVITAADTGSYTFSVANTVPGNTVALSLLEISGAKADAPIAAVGGNYENSYNIHSPLVTPTLTAPASGELALAFFTPNVDYGTVTAYGGFSVVSRAPLFYNDSTVEANSAITAGQAVTAGFTNGASTNGAAILLLLRPDAAPSGVAITATSGQGNTGIPAFTTPSVNAYTLGLAGIDVIHNPGNALLVSTTATQTLAMIGVSLAASGRALRADLSASRNERNFTAVAAEQRRNAPTLDQQSIQNQNELAKLGSREVLAAANVPTASLLNLLTRRG